MNLTKGTPASSQIIWLEQRVKELEEASLTLREEGFRQGLEAAAVMLDQIALYGIAKEIRELTQDQHEPVFFSSCSCEDGGECKHNAMGPLCMQEDQRGTAEASSQKDTDEAGGAVNPQSVPHPTALPKGGTMTTESDLEFVERMRRPPVRLSEDYAATCITRAEDYDRLLHLAEERVMVEKHGLVIIRYKESHDWIVWKAFTSRTDAISTDLSTAIRDCIAKIKEQKA